MNWTVDTLIECLKRLSRDGYGDVKVRIATQPNWPLAYNIGGVSYLENENYEDLKDCVDVDISEGYIWIATGESPYDEPYAPKNAFDEYYCY